VPAVGIVDAVPVLAARLQQSVASSLSSRTPLANIATAILERI
jgi:hypothetical protein